MSASIESYLYTPPAQFDLPNLTISVRAGKLVGLDWGEQKSERFFGVLVWVDKLNKLNDNHQLILQVIEQLNEYFAGKRKQFSIPLDLSAGTDFQQSVWRALGEIDYGRTISYAQLAQNIGKPTAFRACANANGKNPISLIIPCHRVIASSGKIGGYTGGLAIKRTLLAIEGVAVDE